MKSNNNKKVLYLGIALLVLGVGFAVGTYAYYQTSVTGSLNGTVLYWDCNSGTTVAKNTFANMYPGTSGNIKFHLTCSIDADYSIRLSDYSNIAGGGHPNLKLYKDSAHSSASIVNASTSTAQFTGSIAAGGSKDVYVYYDWPYGTASETYSNTTPSFKYTITYTQK